MGKKRLVLIGSGVIGRAHIRHARAHTDCEIVAVSDPSPTAEAFVRENGLRWFATVEAMLEDIRPDGAIVATPNATHLDVGLACIKRGVPVLMEKPIADTIEQATLLSAAAIKEDVPLLVGHHRRHNPILQSAREIIRLGRLGKPVSANGMATFYKPDSYFDIEWRRKKGGGPVLINLIHDIDMMRFLLGDVTEVQALASNRIRRNEVEDTAAVILRFANGALGTLVTSDCAVAPWNWDLAAGEQPRYPRQQVNTHFLAGTEASLSLPQLDVWDYRNGKDWNQPLTLERSFPCNGDPYAEQLRHFCAVISKEETPLCSGEDATRSLATALSVLKAAETRSSVTLAE